MQHRMIQRIAPLLLAGVLPAFHASADDGLRMGVGVEYSTGDYGSVSDTKLWAVPVSAEFTMGPLSFGASIPWLRLTGPGDVIPGLGQVGSVKGRGKGLAGTPSTAQRSTESGLGDVTGFVRYDLPFGVKEQLQFDVTARLKVPTADEDKGLGTGEFDYAVEGGVHQWLGTQLRLDATLGYAILGDGGATPLDNVFYGSLGALYRVDEQFSAGLTFALGEQTSSFGDTRADLTAHVSYDLDRNFRIKGYVMKGFADGSPDRGLGVMLEMRY